MPYRDALAIIQYRKEPLSSFGHVCSSGPGMSDVTSIPSRNRLRSSLVVGSFVAAARAGGWGCSFLQASSSKIAICNRESHRHSLVLSGVADVSLQALSTVPSSLPHVRKGSRWSLAVP